jgi:hypothetical protein
MHMSARARFAIAAAILLLDGGSRGRVRHLVAYVDTNPARLGFEMMGIEIGLAAFAIGSRSRCRSRSAPARARRSRLPIGAVIALTLGTLGLSHAIDAADALGTARARAQRRPGISRGLARRARPRLRDRARRHVLAPALGEELLLPRPAPARLARWIRPFARSRSRALVFGWLHRELVHGAIAALHRRLSRLAAYWSDSTRPPSRATPQQLRRMLGSAGSRPLVPPVPGLVAGLALAALGLFWALALSRPRGEPAAEARASARTASRPTRKGRSRARLRWVPRPCSCSTTASSTTSSRCSRRWRSRSRGSAAARSCAAQPPRDLLIATPRRIDAVREAVGEAVDGRCA